jgi:hypothetical protein
LGRLRERWGRVLVELRAVGSADVVLGGAVALWGYPQAKLWGNL